MTMHPILGKVIPSRGSATTYREGAHSVPLNFRECSGSVVK